MNMNKRIFIAFKLSADEKLLDAFFDIKEKLDEEKIKWVDEKNIHLTIKFIGDVPEHKIPEIINAVEKATSNTKPFEIQLSGMGFFGKPMNPKVIWVGMQKNNNLTILHEKLEIALENIGIAKEKRNFNPHITLGRIKFVTNFYDFMDAISSYKDVDFQIQVLNKLTLFESKLTPKGPIYKPIKVFGLFN